MFLDTDRRAITFFLLILLAVIALKAGDAKTITLALAPITALLARIVAFYFPREGRSALNGRPSGNKKAAKWGLMNHVIWRGRRGSNPRPPA